MQVQVWQAALFGLFACLASMPGLGGTVLGNYTLGRPLAAGLIVGLIMGDVQTGIYLGAAIQVVYIALVTPGGTVSADVRAISYIGIPLSMVAVHSMGLNPASAEGQAMAVTLGSAVGTIGTVLFYGRFAAPGSRYCHPAQAGRDQAGRYSGIRVRLHAGRVHGPQSDRGIDRRRLLRGHQLPHQDPCFAEGRFRSCICFRSGI